MKGAAGVALILCLPCVVGLGMASMALAPGPQRNSHRYHGLAMASEAGPRQVTRRSMCAAAIPGNSLGEEIFVGGAASFFSIFNNLLLGRVLLSWFPAAQSVGFLQPLFSVCDPYLGLFRGIIPAIGGIDLSPLLAFTFLQVAGSSMVALGAQTDASMARMPQRKVHAWSLEAAANRHFAAKSL
mmetsp:Transcript_3202/g.8171  ORF Transcript_3202/g.8171 Transcript_3202/m.8171 type:complete len:184 (-) Transcript_3202:176-727(-)|eukprot:CAMPEP_0174926884 /NCGR_PEP_ID=MMETSP1355-20121228/15816_1 /TAXON_ID=464990 /ORGANISM="Hemiselmis tepida, Strain CCMP443" /LENGTH=183 /DNA_ID=CAMNT_0016172949 /DNA_START=48 /DNA_END=599 /DNA_ORIENTATION=+